MKNIIIIIVSTLAAINILWAIVFGILDYNKDNLDRVIVRNLIVSGINIALASVMLFFWQVLHLK